MTLVTGEEILMQSVLRLESDFMLLRGRMSGSTDAGRVLVIPYDQIVNLAFTKRMLVPEVQAVFGKTLESPDSQGSPKAASEEKPPAAEPAASVGQELARPAATASTHALPPASSAAAKGQAAPPSKSILLARLRARLAEQGK